MGVAQREVHGVDQASHQRKLFGGADGAADADGIVGGGLLPGFDVFEGFGKVELFDGVVEDDLEAGAGETQHVLGREPRGVGEDLGIEGGVVPPFGGEFAELACHEFLSCPVTDLTESGTEVRGSELIGRWWGTARAVKAERSKQDGQCA